MIWDSNPVIMRYDAIEIKSKGFYSSGLKIPYLRSELNIETEKCAIFLISVRRLQTIRKLTTLSDGRPLQT